MRTIKLGSSSLEVPVVAVGCMRINAISKKEAERFVQTALEQGANFFDHADIYGGGECEEIFADAIQMNEAVREKIILQSKCGIREGRFDFSKEYILQSVDGILQRLKTDYLDVLLLHRPDALVEPEEVAEAFDLLESSGKVRHFGVSNQNPMQIELLKKFVRQPIVANQLQLSITNATMISSGINVNMENESAINRDGSVLDYCRLHDVTIQPWSPFQYGFFEGVFLGNDLFPELNKKIDELAEKYEVSNTTIAIAWLLRHPANMQPVIGTMNLKRLKDCCKASEIRLTREEWYEIYRAAGNILP
ncbi:aldo/keto reductase family oxidoreductase [Halalkalibacterium halodurans]|uniref:Aryl-alcohol dehydrogenase n=1 Tax=Halalkalibacterium halodurans (strain ATCC BAA-125 / DSM 18197 / FERM 7344 / JCM 9153 / C-125) TaxID=272558 RepID=Q9K608_HALH5|nr:aldo/keto reductase family oxidoreductase [Halalkalibacterium halodurans]MDY7224434.1 aldo/keto reductase family oxidoreductase [Halalkalibacterium halodurans]MDY7243719.1 aldo/keto reductase family oxidoreductase [Halalkalibacterium halodurans]MED4079639.1 aldo/keto reductase family oxidoreductase [Halalkalibacterium halodurans]MED4084084.1 aldo/keto reductase family oxidoreductase [Halalkalibacterium halodurans]MED4104562.1 aldo/keto reductase family oxidoreductase [Halalkalibacterium hal